MNVRRGPIFDPNSHPLKCFYTDTQQQDGNKMYPQRGIINYFQHPTKNITNKSWLRTIFYSFCGPILKQI